jgi:hypothetical protein
MKPPTLWVLESCQGPISGVFHALEQMGYNPQNGYFDIFW